MAAAIGLVCQILIYTSLVFNHTNNITVEFALPSSSNVNGVGICIDRPRKSENVFITDFILTSQGTDQFDNDTVVLLSDVSNPNKTSFFQRSGDWVVSVVQHGSLYDILATDRFYADSFTRRRYDDFVADSFGNNLVNFFQEPSNPTLASSPTPESLTELEAELAYPRDTSESHSNCIVVSGVWDSTKRYEAVLTVQNPTATDDSNRNPPPRVWIVPLVYKSVTSPSGIPAVQITVVGDKYGRVCNLRSGLIPDHARMLDPCLELYRINGSSTIEQGIQGCVEELRNMSMTYNDTSMFPFNTPPVNPLPVDNQTCPNNTVHSVHEGECVSCVGGSIQPTAAVNGSKCVCDPTSLPLRVGSAACQPIIDPYGQSTTIEGLQASLCKLYTNSYKNMLLGNESDLVVARQYLTAFFKQASFFLDWSDVLHALDEFDQQYMFDPRRPHSPTRTRGLQLSSQYNSPNQLKDLLQGKALGPTDDRFQAVQVFRVVGYILHTQGYKCKDLFDVNNPFKDMYGKFNELICAPLPRQSVTV